MAPQFQSRRRRFKSAGGHAPSLSLVTDSLTPSAGHKVMHSQPKRNGVSASSDTRVTSASTNTTITTALAANASIMAIAESKGIATEVGIAFFDPTSNTCFVSQYADTQAYSKTLHNLAIHEPKRLLMPSTSMTQTNPSKLFVALDECLKNNFADADELKRIKEITAISRKEFNEQSGVEYLKRFALKDSLKSLELLLINKYYALSAIAAVFNFLAQETPSLKFFDHSLRFEYRNCEGTIMLDVGTVSNLELVFNIGNQRGNRTLFHTLNRTATPMGARLLRGNILQPSCNLDIINSRLDTIEKFMNDESFYQDLRRTVKCLPDLDHLIGFIIQNPGKSLVKYTEYCVAKVIQVRALIDQLIPISTLLEKSASQLLQSVFEGIKIEDLLSIRKRIDEIINVEIIINKTPGALRNQRANAVKPGYNGLLDVARQTFNEVTNDIVELVKEYEQAYHFPIKMTYNTQASGYYLTITPDKFESQELPEIFINVVQRRKQLEFTTLQLLKLNQRIEESMTEILLMSDEIISDLMNELRGNVGIFYQASESIALLDMMLALTNYSNCQKPTVRPEFTDTLAILKGRHPVRDAFSFTSPQFVPNDTFMYGGNNFQIITGPNMCGKTTYLKQVALLNVLAQIGCYVPAEYASFRLMDALFSQLSHDDDLESNTSTFLMEMKSIAYILANITDNSLIIIDELGRGTSSFDGMGISCAICEQILKTRAFCLFTTHFLNLADALEIYPNVCNMHLGVEEHVDGDKLDLTYNYKLENGRTEDTDYGISLAKAMGFPSDVLVKAAEVSRCIREKREQLKRSQAESEELQERRLYLQTYERLKQLKTSAIESEPVLLECLERIRQPLLEFKRNKSSRR